MDSDNERPFGNFTNIEGILVDILKHIEKIKIKTDGKLSNVFYLVKILIWQKKV